MRILFNNTQEPVWYRWSGTVDSLEQWLATPQGFSEMVEKRQKSPVIIQVEKDNRYVNVWRDQSGISITGAGEQEEAQ